MRSSLSWPALHRLAALLRATDSFVTTLACEVGLGVAVVPLALKEDVQPDLGLVRFLNFPPGDGQRVQQRRVAMVVTPPGSEQEIVVGRALSHVHLDSPAITPAVRRELREGRALGRVLATLEHRRVPVRVHCTTEVPRGNPQAGVISCVTRLDVAGTPVARCLEQVTEAALTDTRLRRTAGRRV